MTLPTPPLRPERVRRIQGSFTFIPTRFLHAGFLASLTQEEAVLYLFLLLASNRHGVSHYHYDRICAAVRMDGDAYIRARDGLIAKDLVAFDGARFQVLSLPEKPMAPVQKQQACRQRHAQPETRDISLRSIREIIAHD